MAELGERAGIPKGVLNVLTGDSKAIGGELCASSKVRKLSFTGSTETGRVLMKQSADTIKKLSLELGGNAPFIEDLYESYLDNPQSISPEWREYFDRMQLLPGLAGTDAHVRDTRKTTPGLRALETCIGIEAPFLPGTGQEIVSPEHLQKHRPDEVIVMNPIPDATASGVAFRVPVSPVPGPVADAPNEPSALTTAQRGRGPVEPSKRRRFAR